MLPHAECPHAKTESHTSWAECPLAVFPVIPGGARRVGAVIIPAYQRGRLGWQHSGVAHAMLLYTNLEVSGGVLRGVLQADQCTCKPVTCAQRIPTYAAQLERDQQAPTDARTCGL